MPYDFAGYQARKAPAYNDNIDSEVDGFIKLLDEYDWENLRKRAKGLI